MRILRHVKQQLAEQELVPDEWGGNTMVIPVSAKQKQGIDDLLEGILLVADNTAIKANPERQGDRYRDRSRTG